MNRKILFLLCLLLLTGCAASISAGDCADMTEANESISAAAEARFLPKVKLSDVSEFFFYEKSLDIGHAVINPAGVPLTQTIVQCLYPDGTTVSADADTLTVLSVQFPEKNESEEPLPTATVRKIAEKALVGMGFPMDQYTLYSEEETYTGHLSFRWYENAPEDIRTVLAFSLLPDGTPSLLSVSSNGFSSPEAIDKETAQQLLDEYLAECAQTPGRKHYEILNISFSYDTVHDCTMATAFIEYATTEYSKAAKQASYVEVVRLFY